MPFIIDGNYVLTEVYAIGIYLILKKAYKPEMLGANIDEIL